MSIMDSANYDGELVDSKIVQLKLDIDKFQENARSAIKDLNELNQSLRLDTDEFNNGTKSVIESLKELRETLNFKADNFKTTLNDASSSIKDFKDSLDFKINNFKNQASSIIDLFTNIKNATSFEKLEDVAKNSVATIQDQLNSITMNGIEEAAENINSTFSLWGLSLQEVRKTAANFIAKELTAIPRKISSITNNIYGLIKNGGWNRALNLESAKFQLTGLGIAWSKISEDIEYGVKDTAYGLDSAAKAASQLSASGVKVGEDMQAALRGISGVAAMTNRSYDDIAYIYTSIAGMGKVTAQQLNRLSIKGINAFSTLSKYLGVTQAEVREMVTKGQIDFQTFANAMDQAFGEHAKDANKTFTGALSNVKAALSRIGAEIANPLLENSRDILNAIRETINEFKKAIQPVLDAVGQIIDTVGEKLVTFIEGYRDSLKSLNENEEEPFKDLENALLKIDAFLNSDGFDTLVKTIGKIVDGIKDVFSVLVRSVNTLRFLVKPFIDEIVDSINSAVDSILTIAVPMFKGLIEFVRKLSPIIEPILAGISDGILYISLAIRDISQMMDNTMDSWSKWADPLSELIAPLSGTIYKTIVTIFQVIINIGAQIMLHKDSIMKLIVPAITLIADKIRFILLGLSRVFNYLTFIATEIGRDFEPLVQGLYNVLIEVHNLLYGMAKGIENLFIVAWTHVSSLLSVIIYYIRSGVIKGLLNSASYIRDTIVPTIQGVFQNLAYFLGYTFGTITKIFEMTGDGLVGVSELLTEGIFKILEGIFTIAKRIVQTISFIFTGQFVDDNGVLSVDYWGMLADDIGALKGIGEIVFEYLKGIVSEIGSIIGIGIGVIAQSAIIGATFAANFIVEKVKLIKNKVLKVVDDIKESGGIFNLLLNNIYGDESKVQNSVILKVVSSLAKVENYFTQYVVPLFKNLFTSIANFFVNNILPVIGEGFNYFANDIYPILKSIFNSVRDHVIEFKANLPQIVSDLKTAFEFCAPYVKSFVGKSIPIILGFFGDVINLILDAINLLPELISNIRGVFSGEFSIGDIFSKAINLIYNGASKIVDVIYKSGGAIVNALTGGIFSGNGLIGLLSDVFTGTTVHAGDMTEEDWARIAGMLSPDKYQAVVSQYGDSITEATKETLDETQNHISTVTNFSFRSLINDTIIPALNNLVDNINEINIEKIGSIFEILKPIITVWLSTRAIKYVGKKIATALETWNTIFNPFKEIFKPFKDVGDTLAKSTTGVVESYTTFSSSLIKVCKAITKEHNAAAFQSYSKSILLIATSLGVLAGSLIAFSQYGDIQKAYDILPIFGIITGIITAAAVIVMNARPKAEIMSKQITAIDQLLVPIRSSILNIRTNIVSAIKAFKMSTFLVSFASSVAILAYGIKQFTSIDFGTAIKSAVLYGTFLFEIAAANKISGDGLGRFPYSFAIAIPVLAYGIKAFNDVDFGTSVKAAVLFGVFLGEIVAVQWILSALNVDAVHSFSVSFAIMVPILGFGIRAFNDVEWDTAVTAVLTSLGFFAGIALVCKAVNTGKMSLINAVWSLGIVAELMIAVGLIGALASAMTLIDQEKLRAVVISLSLITLAFAAMEVSSKYTGQASKLETIALLLAFGAIVATLSYMASELSNEQIDNLQKISESISIVIGSLTAIVLGFGIVSKWLGSVGNMAAGIAKLGLVITEFLLIVTLIFGLFALIDLGIEHLTEGSNLGDFVQRGVNAISSVVNGVITLVTTLAEGVGQIVACLGGSVGSTLGDLVGGFENGRLASSLDGLDVFLTKTGDSITSLAGVSETNITGTSIQNLKDFGAAIREFVAVGYSQDPFDNLINGLNELSTELPTFASACDVITLDQYTKMEELAKALELYAELSDSVPEVGGLAQKIFGTKDLTSFAEDLGALGAGLREYQTELTEGGNFTFDSGLVDSSANTAKALAELNNNLPPVDGNLGDTVTSSSLKSFAGGLGWLGLGLRNFAKNLGDFDFSEEKYNAAVRIAQTLSELEKNLPAQDGLLQKLIGEQKLSQLGEEISAFAAKMKEYAETVASIELFDQNLVMVVEGEDTLSNVDFSERNSFVQDLGTFFQQLEASLPKQGSAVAKWFVGEQSIATFGENIVTFGTRIKDYGDKLSGTNFSLINQATDIITGMNAAFEGIDYDTYSNVSYFFDMLVDSILSNLNREDRNADYVKAGIKIAGQIAKGIGDNSSIDDLTTAVYKFLDKITNALVKTEIVEKLRGVGTAFATAIIKGIVGAIQNGSDLPFDSIGSALVSAISKAFANDSMLEDLKDIGRYISKGIAVGMIASDAKTIVYNAAKRIGQLAILGLRAGTGVASPSKAAIEVGEFVGEGLIIGLDNIEDPVYQKAKIIGEGIGEAVTSGIESTEVFDASSWIQSHIGLIDESKLVSVTSGTADTRDPASVLRSMGIGSDWLLKIVMSAASSLNRSYETIGEAFRGLDEYGTAARNISLDELNTISRSVGLNPKKFAKAIYDNTFSKWDSNKQSDRPYLTFDDFYNAIINPGLASSSMTTGSMLVDLLNSTYHPEFEETDELSAELLASLNSGVSESDNKLELLLELLKEEHEELLKTIDANYDKKLADLDIDIAEIAKDNEFAQKYYLETINDPNATAEMINAASRNVLINQLGLDSIERNRELLEKEREQEKELEDKKYQNRIEEVKDSYKELNNLSKTNERAFSWSPSNTDGVKDALDELADSGEDAGAETAERLKNSLEAGLSDLDREGYDFASAFADDGWWKKFLDGSQSGLAGYDLGSILAGNTISGIEGLFDSMEGTGWDLASFFNQGLDDALNLDSDTEGVGGILSKLKSMFSDTSDDIGFDLKEIFTDVGEKLSGLVSGIDIDLGGSLTSFAENMGSALEGLGVPVDKVKTFFNDLAMSATNSLQSIADFVKNVFGVDISNITGLATSALSTVTPTVTTTSTPTVTTTPTATSTPTTSSSINTVTPITNIWEIFSKLRDSSVIAAVNQLNDEQKKRAAQYATDYYNQGILADDAVSYALRSVLGTWQSQTKDASGLIVATDEKPQTTINTDNLVIVSDAISNADLASIDAIPQNQNLVIYDTTPTSYTKNLSTITPVTSIAGANPIAYTKNWSMTGTDLATGASSAFSSMRTATTVINNTNTDLNSMQQDLSALNYTVKAISQKLNSQDVMLDSGELVGGISRKMSRALATQQALYARGV